MALVKVPVIDENNEVFTLILDQKTAAKANQDPQFLQDIFIKWKENKCNTEGLNNGNKDVLCVPEINTTEEPDESNSKSFVWPDAAVLLLVELYREREQEFNTGMKRHNIIWGEIAAQIKETDKKYIVTGLQCSTKFAGLKRTYKNIYEQNKKSGNSHSSWAFYSVMDSLLGEKAYIQPPAEASSEGPSQPILSTSGSLSPASFSEDLRSAPKKRRVENILENYIDNIKQERETTKKERDEERKK
ncbi:uncharacterized protein LOC114941365, partial [Nylanderia fulva]|uniref:uncharacterized protein LOC114941365 n=1 Tax=Nylanderia fulva TaxID=613905 RepID=UPI0010FBAB63